MVKQLQKLLFLAAMLFVPWVTQAQTLEDYSFLTGVDTTKWIDMSSATQILTPANSDGMASAVQNIGFSFPFRGNTYTQYSVNTDGNLRLGSTATSTSYYSSPFSSTNSNQNNPKINAFGCDGYGVSSTHYVKALDTVDAGNDTMLVVEFCMGTYTSSTRNQLYKWQVHLYTNGNIDIVYGPTPTTTQPSLPQTHGYYCRQPEYHKFRHQLDRYFLSHFMDSATYFQRLCILRQCGIRLPSLFHRSQSRHSIYSICGRSLLEWRHQCFPHLGCTYQLRPLDLPAIHSEFRRSARVYNHLNADKQPSPLLELP